MQFPSLPFNDENFVPNLVQKCRPKRATAAKPTHPLSGISENTHTATPKPIHPNAYVPGKWASLKNGILATRLPKIAGANTAMEVSLSDENDEFFEATDANFVPHGDNSKAYGAEPHMLEPLVPDGTPLDLSPLKHQKWSSGALSAFPFAGANHLHICDESDECSLLHILNHEVEQLDAEDPSRSLWGSLRAIAFGLNDQEYEQEFPWAKYVQREYRETDHEGVV